VRGGFFCFFLFIFFDSRDSQIKLWNSQSGKCVSTLAGHEGIVQAVDVHRTTIFSASEDKSIKLWDGEKRAVVRTLTGHTQGVRCLKVNNGSICSGGWDGSVKIWDARSGQCVKSCMSHIGFSTVNYRLKNSIQSHNLFCFRLELMREKTQSYLDTAIKHYAFGI